jgi:hypothetical protein
MKMKIERFARGAMLLLAASLTACGSDRAGDDRAAADSSATAPSSASSTAAPSAAPAAPAAPQGPANLANSALRADGIGPLRVGMTVAEADRALGGLDRATGLAQCDYVHPKNGPAHVAFMVEEGRISRVDVEDSASVTTSAGVRPGESEARVREAYPNARVHPHKYDDRGHYFVVIPGAPADTLHRIVFETNGTVVTSMRGGLYPAVEYVEGCS